MKLIEFVDSLPFAVFNELRKIVIARHQRHSEEIMMAVGYFRKQKSLIKAIDTNRNACEGVIAEKCGIPKDIASKVIDRYLLMKEHFDRISEEENKVDKPFE
jgi:hypothetical protein